MRTSGGAAAAVVTVVDVLDVGAVAVVDDVEEADDTADVGGVAGRVVVVDAVPGGVVVEEETAGASPGPTGPGNVVVDLPAPTLGAGTDVTRAPSPVSVASGSDSTSAALSGRTACSDTWEPATRTALQATRPVANVATIQAATKPALRTMARIVPCLRSSGHQGILKVWLSAATARAAGPIVAGCPRS